MRIQPRPEDFIPVLRPKELGVDKLPAQRIPVGQPDDYKPCAGLLPGGELLLVAFRSRSLHDGVHENIVLFRSNDDGLTWSAPQPLDLPGREPYLTVLRDGTVFATVHLLAQDVRNRDGYLHSYLHRSTDGGRTWATLRIGPRGFPRKAHTMTSRNVLELPDGTLLLGVDSSGGRAFLWRSKDGGETWDPSQPCDTGGFTNTFSYFGEAVLWLTRAGKIFAVVRTNSTMHPIAGRPVPGGQGDHRDRMMLYASPDDGRSMRKVMDLGDYGEMYPSVLRLKDGRLLLTFTVRGLKLPLGVQAAFGVGTDDGVTFDFERDRLVLDSKTPRDKVSGGGFGPTVQLADGTLVTAYSYRGADDKTHIEVARWRLPE